MKVNFQSTPKGSNWFYDFMNSGERIDIDARTEAPVVELTGNGIEYHVSGEYIDEVVQILEEARRLRQMTPGIAAGNFHAAARPLPCPACGAYTPGLGVKCSTCGGGGLVASIAMNPQKRTVWNVKSLVAKCS